MIEFHPLTIDNAIACAKMAGVVLDASTRGIVAELRGKIVGCVLFDNWTESAVTAHMASVNPMVWRQMPREVCDYVFNVCGKTVMLGVTPADNEKALKLNKHFGFDEVYRIRDGYKVGVDYVIQQMRAESCRWIDHGKPDSCRAA